MTERAKTETEVYEAIERLVNDNELDNGKAYALSTGERLMLRLSAPNKTGMMLYFSHQQPSTMDDLKRAFKETMSKEIERGIEDIKEMYKDIDNIRDEDVDEIEEETFKEIMKGQVSDDIKHYENVVKQLKR